MLVTGAAGRIGSRFAAYATARFDLRLSDRPGPSLDRLAAFGEVVSAELAELDALAEACSGVDTVVHLAGNPDPDADWSSLLETSIVGTFNAFTAARRAGCRRVVFASSVHTVLGHPRTRQVRVDDPVRPSNLYGVSKCFGEALGHQMSEQGLSVIALRIGAYREPEGAPLPASMIDIEVSSADLNQLLERAILAENVRFAIVNATSDNRATWLDPTSAIELLGNEPGTADGGAGDG